MAKGLDPHISGDRGRHVPPPSIVAANDFDSARVAKSKMEFQRLRVTEHSPVLRLSPRQSQVLALIADGYTEIEIASKLSISPRTVRMHADVLRVKLGVTHRRELSRAYRALCPHDSHECGM